jgi:hypothetical protein
MTSSLVHIEVALENALLHSIWNLGFGHLADWRLHDGDALGSLVTMWT